MASHGQTSGGSRIFARRFEMGRWLSGRSGDVAELAGGGAEREGRGSQPTVAYAPAIYVALDRDVTLRLANPRGSKSLWRLCCCSVENGDHESPSLLQD